MLQSLVLEHVELAWILNCITPMGRLSRIPTFKEKVRQNPDNVNMGLFGYPVLMAADILLYKSEIVPVGEDQVPHLEFTREMARRFNSIFGETFKEPAEVLSKGAKIVGTDGVNKMSKSLDNCIYLDDTDEEISKKLATAMTDPARKRRTDPGDPEVCNIYAYHKVFSTPEEMALCAEGCRTAGIGCVDCKKIVAAHIQETVAPIREKRSELLATPADVREILRAGADRARPIAQETMREVRDKIRHDAGLRSVSLCTSETSVGRTWRWPCWPSPTSSTGSAPLRTLRPASPDRPSGCRTWISARSARTCRICSRRSSP